MSLPILKNELLELLADADLIEKIHLHVSCGGSLISFARMRNVSYYHLRRWLKSDKDREKVYQAALKERDEWSRERILDELRLIAQLDISEILDANGSIVNPELWPAHIKANVASIEVKEEFEMEGRKRVFSGYTKRIKFHDKLKAIEMIGRNLKLWNAEKDTGQGMNLEDILALAIKLEKADGKS